MTAALKAVYSVKGSHRDRNVKKNGYKAWKVSDKIDF